MSDPADSREDAIRRYLDSLLPGPIRALEAQAPPPRESVQPSVGAQVAQLLTVMIMAIEPRRILEIGTCSGYAAIAMGRAARACGGTVLSLEIDPDLAGAARTNVAAAGLAEVVEIVAGDANQILDTLPGGFGLVLQDGAKLDYLRQLPRLVALLESGGVLVTDDVLFPVMDLPGSVAGWQEAVGQYNLALRDHDQLQSTWIPIGDGVAVSVKRPPARRVQTT